MATSPRTPLDPDSPRIIDENEVLLVVDKPAGLDVFPARRGRSDSLWGWLQSLRPDILPVGDPLAPCFAHRLDRVTSGILVAARDEPTYRLLRDAFSRGLVRKSYLALIEGRLDEHREVDVPLGERYRRSRKVSVATPGRRLRGIRPAHTVVQPLQAGNDLSLCRVLISTGVRHQIRIHLAHLGHPIAGDDLYGATRSVPALRDRIFLHAEALRLDAPPGSWRSPLPPSLCTLLEEQGFSLPLDEPGGSC